MESHASIDVLATEPQVIGRYALFDELAAGGMATVHLGRFVGHVGFSRIVAIKRLHPQFAKDPEFVAMFLDEARLASRIQHPNVVSTLDVVKLANEAFLVMEYVQGASLSRLLKASIDRGEKIPQDIACSVAANMLHGLHAAHEAKSEKREPLAIVHRDVSPQNVIVGVDGVARVLDFGIAKAAMRSQSTRDGQMKGKLSYMSPEQLNGVDVDRRTDIFAAGVVLWEALAGKRLFDGADAGQILAKVLTLPIPSPKQFNPAVTDGIVKIIAKALERDPAKRFQTAKDFAIAIEDEVVFPRPRTIGEWVQKLARTDLERRSELVSHVESWSSEGRTDVEFVTVHETGESDESTGLRARPSPPPAAGSPTTEHPPGKRQRIATSPSQVSERVSRENLVTSGPRGRIATSPSQVSKRMKAPPLPPAIPPAAPVDAAENVDTIAPPRPGGLPLPPLVTPAAPRARVATSPSLIAQRAPMLGGAVPPLPEPPRQRVATTPSQIASRSAVLGAPPLPPPPLAGEPRPRVATSPSQVAARSAMLGGAALPDIPSPPERNLERARQLTTPAQYRLNPNAVPLPPGVAPRGATPPPPQAAAVAMPVLPAPPGAAAPLTAAEPTPEFRKKRAMPLWAVGVALALAAAGGALLARTPQETVSTPDFGAGEQKPEAPKPTTTTPAATSTNTVPVVSPTDLPIESATPPAAPKAETPPQPKPETPTATTPPKSHNPGKTAAAGCNPPYTIDAKGIKRLKPNCL